MSALVWGIEWRLALSRKRDFALWVAFPVVIVLVMATGGVTQEALAGAYTALFVAFGVLRTAVPVLRDAERGMMVRVVRGGMSHAGYLVQRAGAGATLSLVQLLPALLVAVAFLGATALEGLATVGALAVTLWTVNVLGVLMMAASRSLSEAAALCAVSLVLLLHMSGVFRTPAAGGAAAALEGASPFRALHESFAAVASEGAVGGGVAAVVWALAMTLLVGALAGRLTASLAR